MVAAMEAMEARILEKLAKLDGLEDRFVDLNSKFDLQASRLTQMEMKMDLSMEKLGKLEADQILAMQAWQVSEASPQVASPPSALGDGIIGPRPHTAPQLQVSLPSRPFCPDTPVGTTTRSCRHMKNNLWRL